MPTDPRFSDFQPVGDEPLRGLGEDVAEKPQLPQPAVAATEGRRGRSRRHWRFEANEEAEEWVISYMDMVTLIMCAFVVIAALLDLQSSHTSQAFASGAQGTTDRAAATAVPQIVPPIEASPGKGEGVIGEPTAGSTLAQHASQVDQDPSTESGQATDQSKLAFAAIPASMQAPDRPATVVDPPKANGADVAANDAKVEEAWRSAVAAQGLDGRVTISAKGRIITMQIQDEILFPTGEADLQTGGRDVIRRIAPLLSNATGNIRVEGHTDNVPISNDRFASNWELSSERATSVVRALIDSGIAAGRLGATGYADTRPEQPNDSESGRARNRRVSLLIEQ